MMPKLKSGSAIVSHCQANLSHAIRLRCSCQSQRMKRHPATPWQMRTCCLVCRSLSQTGRLSTSSAAAPRRWCLSCPFTGKEVSHVWVDRRNELLRMPKVPAQETETPSNNNNTATEESHGKKERPHTNNGAKRKV